MRVRCSSWLARIQSHLCSLYCSLHISWHRPDQHHFWTPLAKHLPLSHFWADFNETMSKIHRLLTRVLWYQFRSPRGSFWKLGFSVAVVVLRKFRRWGEQGCGYSKDNKVWGYHPAIPSSDLGRTGLGMHPLQATKKYNFENHTIGVRFFTQSEWAQ